jgi:hypothetical protein
VQCCAICRCAALSYCVSTAACLQTARCGLVTVYSTSFIVSIRVLLYMYVRLMSYSIANAADSLAWCNIVAPSLSTALQCRVRFHAGASSRMWRDATSSPFTSMLHCTLAWLNTCILSAGRDAIFHVVLMTSPRPWYSVPYSPALAIGTPKKHISCGVVLYCFGGCAVTARTNLPLSIIKAKRNHEQKYCNGLQHSTVRPYLSPRDCQKSAER